MFINLHYTLYMPNFQGLNVIVIQMLSVGWAIGGQMIAKGVLVAESLAEMRPEMGEIGKKRLIL